MLVPVLSLLLLLTGLAVLLQPMIGFLHGSWTDQYGAHSHGYLVLALACYFAWRKLSDSPPRHFKPSFSAAIPLAAVLAAAFAAQILYVGPIQTILTPVIVALCLALCLGWATAWQLAWPVLFLYFAMPAWGPINLLLQNLTIGASTAMLGLTHIPFYVEGNYVQLGSGTFQIASGCSGLNYFIAALTIAATQCTLHLTTTASRVKLMVAAALAGLFANWVRVASLIAIGHFSEMRHYLIRVEHFWFGWFLFIGLLVPVVLYGRRLAEREPERSATAAPAPWVPPMKWLWALFAMGTSAAVIIAVVLIRSLQPVPVDFLASVTTRMTAVTEFASGWRPHVAEAQQSEARMGTLDGVEIYQLRFPVQTRQSYLGHPGNSITGDSWQVSERHTVDLQLDGRAITAVEYVGQLGKQQHILWVFPTVGGRVAPSRVPMVTAMLVSRLRGRRDAEVWAFQAACGGGCDQARARLHAVLAEGGIQ